MCLLAGLINSNDFKHLTIGTCSYCLLQLVSTSPIYLIFQPKVNWHSASVFSASSLIIVTSEIYKMAQSKVNRELTDLGVSLTNIDTNKGCAT